MKQQGRNPKPVDIDAVLLSHAHADHANHISFLHEDIPVHCGKTALDILEAVNETGKKSIDSDVIEFRKRPCFNYREAPIKRKFKTFRTGDKFKIGSFEIEPIHVDHSVPGAYGFVIYTSEGAVVYTGDLRLHGAHPEMTQDFVEKAIASNPIAMLCEGTRIDKPKTNESEQTVYAGSKGVINTTKGLAFADFNVKDVDRMRTFAKIAKDTNRKLAINFKAASFLKRYAEDPVLNIPNLGDPNIVIFKRKKKSGTYKDSDYQNYQKPFLNLKNIVTAEDIRKNQDKYLLCLNFWTLQDLVDLKPAAGSTYIRSMSEPFNEEMAISHERMENWLKHFNLKKVQCHCSGHAAGPDIKKMVKDIAPKKLYPIHTEHPEMFKGLAKEVIQVKVGQSYKM
jgi:ribonuclease J